jgi:hypothetical protein
MKPLGDGSIIKYTQGKCFQFATALWAEHGKRHRLCIFWTPDCRYAHAALEIARGRYIDVEGVHVGTRATKKHFGFTDIKFYDDPKNDIDWKKMSRRKGWAEHVRKARWLIRRHRARYLLTG